MPPPVFHTFCPGLKFSLTRLVFAALFSTASLALADSKPQLATQPFTAREIQQGYRDHVVLAKPRAARRASVQAEEEREGMRVRLRWDRFGGIRELEIAPGETPAEAVRRLRATGRYEYVQTDTLRYATATPNDTSYTRHCSRAPTGACSSDHSVSPWRSAACQSERTRTGRWRGGV